MTTTTIKLSLFLRGDIKSGRLYQADITATVNADAYKCDFTITHVDAWPPELGHIVGTGQMELGNAMLYVTANNCRISFPVSGIQFHR